jgi:CubicO group peptidase (beta-lactamase class C family)
VRLFFTLLLGLLTFRTVAQTGIAVPELAHCDAGMQQFMQRWKVLGASVALAKDGKLVYERAFGYADVAHSAPLQPYHLMRIASVSKTVTALAIMKLVEAGKLSLSHKVFGLQGYLTTPAYTQEIHDPRILAITVQQLLEHTAGWDRNSGCDGQSTCDPIDFPTHVAQEMQVPNPVGDSTIIRYMLRQGLNYAPGSRFAYSNVGYLVLGKVIEAVTKQGYEQWVRQQVLRPCGISEARLGHNLPADRIEHESEYQSRYSMPSCYNPGQQVPAAYGGYQVEAMNAHGGWLFSARDLVRLVLATDGFPSRPDIISTATLQIMTQPSAVAPWYAKGWMVDGSSWWHTGQLDGTTSLVVRTASGYSWAILLNTDNNSSQFWKELKELGWTWTVSTTTWPAQDLFRPEQNATTLQVCFTDSSYIFITWSKGTNNHRLLLLKKNSSATSSPFDGLSYPISTVLADWKLYSSKQQTQPCISTLLEPL